MSVVFAQFVDGVLAHESVVQPHFEGQTDAELLAAKAKGADDKEWDVEWLSPFSFVARKVRWVDERLCERVFAVT